MEVTSALIFGSTALVIQFIGQPFFFAVSAVFAIFAFFAAPIFFTVSAWRRKRMYLVATASCRHTFGKVADKCGNFGHDFGGAPAVAAKIVGNDVNNGGPDNGTV